jgi:hypothetical protein
MNTLLLILTIITIIIFFRAEVLGLLEKFNKFPYLLVCLTLFFVNYLLLLNDSLLDHLILVVDHNLHHFKTFIFNILNHFLSFKQVDFLSDILLRGIILGFCIFYPYYYQKKFHSVVYLSQNYSVQMSYYFLTLFFCLFFARFDI